MAVVNVLEIFSKMGTLETIFSEFKTVCSPYTHRQFDDFKTQNTFFFFKQNPVGDTVNWL